MMKKRKIMIEDNGQDVLWFVTDEEDKVIDPKECLGGQLHSE